MKIIKKLSYGVNENTDERLLYVKRIILNGDPDKIKFFLAIMSNYKIFQYNYDKAKDCDYFFWQYVDDKGNKDFTHIELSCYDNNIYGVYKMWSLYKICSTTYTDIEAIITFDNIENLINKIKEEK